MSTHKPHSTPGPLARANDRDRREAAMIRFIGNLSLTRAWLRLVTENAEKLAAKDPDASYTMAELNAFDGAEVALPYDLTRLNIAVERMNADLGAWIGAGK